MREQGTGSADRESLRGRLERLSLGVPFRAKVGVVLAAIFAGLAVLFALAGFDTSWMRSHAAFIVKGLWVTVFVSIVSIILAIILAILGALARLSRNPIAYGVSGFYVSFFRGTPLIVQLFLIYLALAQIAINVAPRLASPFNSWIKQILILSPVAAGILGLGLNYGAYMTEIFRAGIQSVSHGQSEAAEALGMTYRQKMRRVVLPQAFRVIIPPTGNEFIAMMKDSALLSFLGADIFWSDIFRRATIVGQADFKNLEALVLAAGMYWFLTAVFTFFQRKLETRVGKGYVRQVAIPTARRSRWLSGSAAGGYGGGAMMVDVPEPDETEKPAP